MSGISTAESADWRRSPAWATAHRGQWLRPADAARLARRERVLVTLWPDGSMTFDGTAKKEKRAQENVQHADQHVQPGGPKKIAGALQAGRQRQANGLPSRKRGGAETNTPEAYYARQAKKAAATAAATAAAAETTAAAAQQQAANEEAVAATPAAAIEVATAVDAAAAVDISVPDRHAATVEGGKRQAVVASAEVATAVKVAVRTPQHTPPPKTKRSMQFEVKGVEKGKGKGSAEKFKEITRGAKMVAAAAANGK